MENLLWYFLAGMLGGDLLKKIKNGEIKTPLIIIFLCLLSTTQIFFLTVISAIDFLRSFKPDVTASQMDYAALFYGCFIFSLLTCIALKAIRLCEKAPKT